jgi:hypothetical protein
MIVRVANGAWLANASAWRLMLALNHQTLDLSPTLGLSPTLDLSPTPDSLSMLGRLPTLDPFSTRASPPTVE